MTHQVHEQYNGTNHKQGDTKLLKLLNNYLLMMTSKYSKNCLIRFEISNNVAMFDSV